MLIIYQSFSLSCHTHSDYGLHRVPDNYDYGLLRLPDPPIGLTATWPVDTGYLRLLSTDIF
jgi:hypothetical protein